MILIGLSGKKRAGKDTVVNFIKELTPWAVVKIAFADELKKEVAKACGVSVEFIEKNKGLFRPILQWWGSDFRRKLTSENYWIKKVQEKLLTVCDNDELVVCISDVRFKNEAAFIQDVGGYLVRIHRPEISYDQHISETELDTHRFDLYVDNISTLEHLKKETRNMLKEIKLKQKLKITQNEKDTQTTIN